MDHIQIQSIDIDIEGDQPNGTHDKCPVRTPLSLPPIKDLHGNITGPLEDHSELSCLPFMGQLDFGLKFGMLS